MDSKAPTPDLALVVEGVFYKDDEGRIRPESGSHIDHQLAPFEGRAVVATVHHNPPDPPTDEWGGGSCMWQSMGTCPAGHHTRPDWLHHVSATGPLLRDGSGWSVAGIPLRLELLEGHRSRVALVEVFDPATATSGTAEDLLKRAEGLNELLRELADKLGENR
jgi:hypothetical protein